VLFLSLIGILLAFAAGKAWGVFAGIAVGFLLVGGLGWKILGGGISLVRSSLTPTRRRKTDEFWSAWEARYGPVVRGLETTYPPPGVFPSWYRAWKRTGVSAADYLGYSASRDPIHAPRAMQQMTAPGHISGALPSEILDGSVVISDDGLIFHDEVSQVTIPFLIPFLSIDWLRLEDDPISDFASAHPIFTDAVPSIWGSASSASGIADSWRFVIAPETVAATNTWVDELARQCELEPRDPQSDL